MTGRCDVLMPVHNGSLSHLIAAVESILSQRDVLVRLLIADDGSDDGQVREWLHAQNRDNVIVITRSEQCQGVSAALNRLLPMCQSEFVARMDADDVAAPTRLAEQIAFLRAHPDVDVVGTNAVLFSESAKRRTTLPTAPAAVHFGMLFACTLVHPSVMWRAEMSNNIVYDASEHPRCEDFALWHALLRRGFKLANLDAPLLHLRKHRHSVSSVHSEEQRRSTAALASLAYDAERLESLEQVLALRGAILDAVPRVCEWAGDKFSSDERAAVGACAEERVAELLTLAMQRLPQHATPLIQAMPPRLLADLLASMAAPRRSAPKLLPWSSPTITALLFSKDRPFQAQQCLRSFDAAIVQPYAAHVNFSIHVLYAASSERIRANYVKLVRSSSGVTFIDEANESCDAVLRRLFKPTDAFAMFLVDDIVWYRTPPALPAALERLASQNDLFALQLRLHRNVSQSVTTDHECAPPKSLITRDQWCEWRTDADDAVAEWRYPFDLSGAIYRQRDIASIVHTAATLLGAADSLTHPNRFENAGNQVLRRQLLAELDSAVRLTCPAEPCMSIVTVNRVQQVCANPICGAERSIDELLELFERDASSFDIARYRSESSRFTAVHIGDWFLN